MQLHDSRALDTTDVPFLPYSQLFDKLDTISDVLTPAAVLPEQFYSPLSPAKEWSGHITLRWAVLTDALHCFTQTSKKGKRRDQQVGKEVAAWFFTDDTYWPFSFVNICATLGLDPAYIRGKLLQSMQHEPVKRTPRRSYTGRRSF